MTTTTTTFKNSLTSMAFRNMYFASNNAQAARNLMIVS